MNNSEIIDEINQYNILLLFFDKKNAGMLFEIVEKPLQIKILAILLIINNNIMKLKKIIKIL